MTDLITKCSWVNTTYNCPLFGPYFREEILAKVILLVMIPRDDTVSSHRNSRLAGMGFLVLASIGLETAQKGKRKIIIKCILLFTTHPTQCLGWWTKM